MLRALKLHPDSRCPAVTRIEAEALRPSPGRLVLRYVVTGRTSSLRLPPARAPARADGLWRHTCFEAFVQGSPEAGYYEFNFAPSLRWAAFRLDGYRSGMTVARRIGAPHVEVRSDGARCDLRASLELDGLPDLPSDAAWRLGLSAVIEDTSGRLSYWALAHPPGQADFHHSDCFALELPVAVRP